MLLGSRVHQGYQLIKSMGGICTYISHKNQPWGSNDSFQTAFLLLVVQKSGDQHLRSHYQPQRKVRRISEPSTVWKNVVSSWQEMVFCWQWFTTSGSTKIENHESFGASCWYKIELGMFTPRLLHTEKPPKNWVVHKSTWPRRISFLIFYHHPFVTYPYQKQVPQTKGLKRPVLLDNCGW